MGKYISMMWSEGVLEEESEVFSRTVEGTLKWLYVRHPLALADPPIQMRLYGNWVITALVPDNPYWGTLWYIDTSYDNDLQRVVAPVFLELVRQEPWQRLDPHFDLALLDQDLTDFPSPLARLRPDHYALGTSFPGHDRHVATACARWPIGASASCAGASRAPPPGARDGHPEFSQSVQRLGLELHCVNCHRHAGTVENRRRSPWTELGWPFCDACTWTSHVIVRQQFSWS